MALADSYEVMIDGPECQIWWSPDLRDALAAYAEKSSAAKKDVKKIGHILKVLADLGSARLQNKTQFRHEYNISVGQFGRVAVFAVKSHQLRVYGGFAQYNGRKSFMCVEMAEKKKDKADPAQLKRVAAALGEVK